ncbi:MAG: MerR family transcriptional regulator [Emergencia sp.]|nr:MerR family transcriptional regulator [Emergencia sp.]
MKKYYKIGEISKLYGIGPDSLRYYEEIGILKPGRDDNGYRMYTISDIRTLNILRELRSIGFSMEEIKSHLRDFDVDKTLALFRREVIAVEEKISQLNQLKSHLSERIAEMENHLRSEFVFDGAELRHIPERKILKLSENVYRDEDLDLVIKELQKKNQNQLYLIGNGDMGASLPLSPISSGTYGHFNAVFCRVDEGESFDTIIPAGDYLCTTIRGSYAKMPAAWESLFGELKSRGLKAAGDPMEFYIIDNHDTNHEEEYITQLQIPVE